MSNNDATAQQNTAAILQSIKASQNPWTPGQIGPMTVGQILTTGTVQAYAPNNASFQFQPQGTVSSLPMSQGLELRGDADIKIDGLSLKDFMKQVTLRLNMMVPHPELERQWDELRTLGEAYRACEKECLDKAKVWDILKRD